MESMIRNAIIQNVTTTTDDGVTTGSVIIAPQWMFDLHEFRQRAFLEYIEPIIVALVGPMEEEGVPTFGASHDTYADDVSQHRRLGFLPSYVEDVSRFRETSMSFATLVMLFIIMSCLVLVFLSCFHHNQKTSPIFISPRRHRLPKLVPPPLPVDGHFSWMKVCFFMSDEEIINRVGYDSLIFLRFHRLALRCIVKMSVFSFIVLLPLNFTGGGHANASDLKGYVGSLLFTDFLRFTMANVSGGSPRLWVHCFAAYLLTGIVVKELLVEYNAFNTIRHRYLLSKEPHLRTVLVTNIPRHLRAPKKISTYFRHVYPEAVKSVTMCQNLIQLERLVVNRTAVLAQTERQLLLLCRSEKRQLLGMSKLENCSRFLTSCPCLLFEKLGVMNGPQDRLARLYSKIEEMNDKVEKEQARRRRVMKKMDKMEAATGRKDIDYILASPFMGDAASVDSGRRTADHDGNLQYCPPTIGAPRKPDGSLFTSHQSSFSQVATPPFQGGDIEDNQQITSPTRLRQDTLESLDHPDVVSAASDVVAAAGSNINHYHDGPRDPTSSAAAAAAADPYPSPQYYSDDPNSKLHRKSFGRAKAALRRYSLLVREVSLWGRPYPTVEIDDDTADPKNKMSGFIEDHTNEVCDKAFVAMRTYTASTIAIQSMHSSKPGSMEVTTAPEPRDILWENVYVSKGAKRTRAIIGDVVILFMITFYIIPVALVSLLVSESALISSSPRLAQLDQASAFFSSAIAMVQPICIVCIQQLLPPLFMQITKAEGLISFSEVQMKAFSRYFLFQVVNVFLVTAVAGSIFDTIAIIIENPETAFEMLGNSLPRMSSFFITFVTMKTFLGLGVELIRMVSIVQASLRYILFPNSTLRAQRNVRIGMRAIDDPGWFPFHKVLAQDMLVVVISVVFAVVAPIVLFPCALFCLFSRIVWTHHHLYVFESVFETGGQFWPKIFRRFIFGLIIAQATITGQFILKEARHEAYATIALMFLTYIFLRRTRARYDAASSTLPLEVATVMDISLAQEEERARKRQEKHLRSQEAQPTHSFQSDDRTGDRNITAQSSNEDSHEHHLGTVIGHVDPFEHAYLQPALRADPRARPEQPFPPAQLGREEVLIQQSTYNNLRCDNNLFNSSASVRLKSMNLQDRTLIDRWWKDQLQRCGEQDILPILIGEESGKLTIGRRTHPFEYD
mmetsp:Transcript_15271/g.22739  ORF Transcript_15271/g.22739 Transcript_15271/m.22739 type:complete len:1183 (-) Transcript_15271:1847-5395(-)